uniref:Uncharacterized protein n=1 Tax=Aegilops tauschii subsp. strangulata TaxID=200361 RepID=A0A453A4J6_AEGTS
IRFCIFCLFIDTCGCCQHRLHCHPRQLQWFRWNLDSLVHLHVPPRVWIMELLRLAVCVVRVTSPGAVIPFWSVQCLQL